MLEERKKERKNERKKERKKEEFVATKVVGFSATKNSSTPFEQQSANLLFEGTFIARNW